MKGNSLISLNLDTPRGTSEEALFSSSCRTSPDRLRKCLFWLAIAIAFLASLAWGLQSGYKVAFQGYIIGAYILFNFVPACYHLFLSLRTPPVKVTRSGIEVPDDEGGITWIDFSQLEEVRFSRGIHFKTASSSCHLPANRLYVVRSWATSIRSERSAAAMSPVPVSLRPAPSRSSSRRFSRLSPRWAIWARCRRLSNSQKAARSASLRSLDALWSSGVPSLGR